MTAESLSEIERQRELDEQEQASLCNAKTPVSLLQELYVRRGMTPKYDLVQIEGAVHEPIFKYRVTVGEFVATGCGQSKKKAKHSAAKAILDKLLNAQNAGVAPPGQPIIPDLAQDIFSPYDDGIEGNPVGILQELCMSRRCPPPLYDLSHEKGLPHERSFIIVCIIGPYREVGAGKSKKLAKRQAANKMIRRLQLVPSENDDANQNIDEDDLAQGIAIRVKETSQKSGQAQVNKSHKILKNAVGENIRKLHENEPSSKHGGKNESKSCGPNSSENCHPDEEDNFTPATCDPDMMENNDVKFLEDIATEQNFEVTYVKIEETSKKGFYHCLVQLATVPVFVCAGKGLTEQKAKEDSATQAIKFLRTMTKK